MKYRKKLLKSQKKPKNQSPFILPPPYYYLYIFHVKRPHHGKNGKNRSRFYGEHHLYFFCRIVVDSQCIRQQAREEKQRREK
jgi:hypothetical protein